MSRAARTTTPALDVRDRAYDALGERFDAVMPLARYWLGPLDRIVLAAAPGIGINQLVAAKRAA